MELLPDLGSLSDEELKQLKDDLEAQERELSYQRRVLHGKIDILRAEIVARLQRTGGPERARRARRRPADGDPHGQGDAAGMSSAGGWPMSHVYCSECGFLNPEAANYCSRCGALLEKGDAASETTQSFSADEVGEHEHDLLDGLEGPALVVRSGGGRAGESVPARGRADAHRPLARTARSSSTT